MLTTFVSSIKWLNLMAYATGNNCRLNTTQWKSEELNLEIICEREVSRNGRQNERIWSCSKTSEKLIKIAQTCHFSWILPLSMFKKQKCCVDLIPVKIWQTGHSNSNELIGIRNTLSTTKVQCVPTRLIKTYPHTCLLW